MEHSDDIDTENFSGVRPGSVAKLSAEDETSDVSSAVVDVQNAEVKPVVSEVKEKPVSPRMEKLRAYYAQLGQVREMMDNKGNSALEVNLDAQPCRKHPIFHTAA